MYNILRTDLLFKALALVSTFVLFVFFIAGYFTIYYDLNTERFIFLDIRRAFLETKTLTFFALISGLLMVSIILSRLKDIKKICSECKFLFIFLAYFIIYYSVFGGAYRSMFFFSILCTFFIYGVIPFFTKQKQLESSYINVKKAIIYSCALYLILPLIVYLIHYGITFDKYFQFDFGPQPYIVNSFRGLSLNRVQYGFLTGIILLVVILEKKDISYSYLVVFLLSIGLYFSSMRAAMLALIIAILFYLFSSKIKSFKIIVFYMFIFLLIVGLLLSFSVRSDILSSGVEQRIILLKAAIDIIFKQGYVSFLFGSGDFYTTYNSGVYPHNAILQSMMNFGAITTMLWLIISFLYFKNLTFKGKTLFLYVFVFAQLHPNFSAFVFLPITFFSYICISLFNIQDNEDCDNCSIA